MATTDMSSLSLQPWARDRGDEGKLSEVLARVSGERGHFRDITEATLQEEVAAEGALELSESELEDDSDDDQNVEGRQTAKARPSSREELFKAKYEMLAHVRAAEQEILMSLDFVSLLLSKDAPRQAQSTISPVLKDAAPLGSLGTDLWQRMPVNRAQEAQDDLLATNVRMESLQQSADSLLVAATRLETNVRTETRYWDQILSISDAGWSVCRIPGDRHRLGVNFGFNESAPEFSRRGLAAFNANSDGDITLEQGIGTKPRALRVTIQRNGEIVGSSRLPKILDEDESTLEARMRHARDSLFDEELYHEMIRESRNLASLGVTMKGSTILVGSGGASDTTLQVSFGLQSLYEDERIPSKATTEANDFAQGLVLAAKLLLCQAHREKLKKRSQMPAPVMGKTEEERPVLPILRPLMSFLMHKSALDRFNALLLGAIGMLETASVQCTYELAELSLPPEAAITSSEILVSTCMQTWVSEGKITILDPQSRELTLDFELKSTLAQGFGSHFTLSAPPRGNTSRADDISELVSAMDAKLAALLAAALAETMGNGWKYNENQALMSKDNGVSEKVKSMWVRVHSAEQSVSLHSPTKTMSWGVGGENASNGFWEAKEDILQS